MASSESPRQADCMEQKTFYLFQKKVFFNVTSKSFLIKVNFHKTAQTKRASLHQMVCRRSTTAFLQGSSIRDGVIDANGTGSKQKSKTLKDLLDDLEVDTCAIRYRRRSLERRSALSTLYHPHFDPLGDDVGAIGSSTTVSPLSETRHALEKEINHYSLTTKEDLINMEKSNLPSRERESVRMAVKVTNGVKANFRLPKRISNTLSDHVSITGTTLHLRKRASIFVVVNSMLNLESLRRVSPEIFQRKKRDSDSISSEPMSQRLRRTTSFLRFYAKQEDADVVRREGMERGKEVNVLLQTMRRNDSRNLLNALPQNTW